MAFNLGNSIVGSLKQAAKTQLVSAAQQKLSAYQSANQFTGDNLNAGNFIKSTLAKAASSYLDKMTSPKGFNSAARSQNLKNQQRLDPIAVTAAFKSSREEGDWRVKLSIPDQISAFSDSALLQPLAKTNGFTFPYTPTIVLGHSANYNSLAPVQSNFPFQIYENSQTDDIVITGEFTVQTVEEGKYWLGAIHYLRSVTKMFYGNGDNLGNPPPVVRLNGYGDFVFKDVPVVITNFTVDLQSDVDYVQIPVSGSDGAWVPTQSQVSVTCRPAYSRNTVAQFDLKTFVSGGYLLGDKGFM